MARFICEGSNLDAGHAGVGKLHLPCPVCGVSVAIGYQNRFETHGKTRGQGGRKPKRVGGSPAAKEPQ